MTRYLFLVAFISILVIASCNSGPGPGGQATITGKVHVHGNWNSSCTILDTSSTFTPYYDLDDDVYLVYGDDPTYGDRVKTSPDGTFRFVYLRKGKYTVYVYSKDCTTASGKMAVMAQVEITDKKGTAQLTDMEIYK